MGGWQCQPTHGCCWARSDPPSPQECSGLGDMPGSFVPTVTAITTSQDLQWMVQPTLISSVAQSQPPGAPMAHPPPVDPYDLPGPSYSTPGMGAFTTGPAAPPARSTRARPRRSREETVSGIPVPWVDGGARRVGGTLGTQLMVLSLWQLTPEEEEKRRVRRERNKLAAAKCRNRRRELTDRLQAVSAWGHTGDSGVTTARGVWGGHWWLPGTVEGWPCPQGLGALQGDGSMSMGVSPRRCLGTVVSSGHGDIGRGWLT